jgi:rare lipoprotein A
VSYKGKSVVVRVNDRGPFIKGRQLDLSRGAARQLGMLNAGVAAVQVDVM